MSVSSKDWTKEAKDDAKELVAEQIDDVIEGGRFRLDDRRLFEHVTDRGYGPIEAVELLEELGDFEETDSGLWQGQDWRDTLSTVAAYTYTNAVVSYVDDLVEELKEAIDEVGEEEEEGEISSRKRWAPGVKQPTREDRIKDAITRVMENF